MSIGDDSRARPSDLTVEGHVCLDDGGSARVEIRLVIPAMVATLGRGTVEFHVVGTEIDVAGAELRWLTTTNGGWTHFGGQGWGSDQTARFPIRADIFSAQDDADKPDRIAVRIYAAGTDPSVASPVGKINGWFESGGVNCSLRLQEKASRG